MPPYAVLAIQMHFSHQYHQCLPYVTVSHSQVLLHFQAVMSVLNPIARKVFTDCLFPAFSIHYAQGKGQIKLQMQPLL